MRLLRRLVPTFEVELSDDTHFQLQRLIDDEFVTEEQAFEELLSAGLEAYRTEPMDEGPEEGFSETGSGRTWPTRRRNTDSTPRPGPRRWCGPTSTAGSTSRTPKATPAACSTGSATPDRSVALGPPSP